MKLQEETWGDAFHAENAAHLVEQCVASSKRARAHVLERKQHREREQAKEAGRRKRGAEPAQEAKQARQKRAKLVAGQFTRDELSAAVAGEELVWRAVRLAAAQSDASTSNAGAEEASSASATASRYGSPAKKKRHKGPTAMEREAARFQALFQGATQVRHRAATGPLPCTA